MFTSTIYVCRSSSVDFIVAQSPPLNCYNFPGMADCVTFSVRDLVRCGIGAVHIPSHRVPSSCSSSPYILDWIAGVR